MKYWLLLLVTSLIACSGKQPAGCDRFHSGKFYYIVKPAGYRVTINRNDSLQTELNSKTDSVTGYTIKWKGNCEYELVKQYKAKKQAPNSPAPNRVIEFGKIAPLKTRIIETTTDFYVFESRKEGIDFVFRDTIWILK